MTPQYYLLADGTMGVLNGNRFRAISNGGSATCDSVGTAGALCEVDAQGTVISNEGVNTFL
jgi:hypothetical protein